MGGNNISLLIFFQIQTWKNASEFLNKVRSWPGRQHQQREKGKKKRAIRVSGSNTCTAMFNGRLSKEMARRRTGSMTSKTFPPPSLTIFYSSRGIYIYTAHTHISWKREENGKKLFRAARRIHLSTHTHTENCRPIFFFSFHSSSCSSDLLLQSYTSIAKLPVNSISFNL